MTAWSTKDIPDQTGRTAVVTGANSGIGLETVRALLAAGADVVMACRDQTRGERAKLDLAVAVQGRATVMQLDVSRPQSVRHFAEAFAKRFEHLDLLINNAGVMATPPQLTEDGVELQWATNHLGHYVLTGLLLPCFVDRQARVVSVSSLAAAGGNTAAPIRTDLEGYSRFGVYSDTKLANQIFAVELNQRLAAINSPAISVAAHPGVSHTNLSSGFGLPVGTRVIQGLSGLLTQSAADGALPILRAATDPLVEGGQYYGPAGRRQHRGRPKQVPLIPGVARRSVGRGLWEQSAELSGVRFLSGD